MNRVTKTYQVVTILVIAMLGVVLGQAEGATVLKDFN